MTVLYGQIARDHSSLINAIRHSVHGSVTQLMNRSPRGKPASREPRAGRPGADGLGPADRVQTDRIRQTGRGRDWVRETGAHGSDPGRAKTGGCRQREQQLIFAHLPIFATGPGSLATQL